MRSPEPKKWIKSMRDVPNYSETNILIYRFIVINHAVKSVIKLQSEGARLHQISLSKFKYLSKLDS